MLQATIADKTILILPGWQNSGPDHWQTLWENALPNAQRVEQSDWLRPQCDVWVETLHKAVVAADKPVVLVGHSLACAQVANWVATYDSTGVAAAFLVAPADVDSAENTPDDLRSFAPIPLVRFPFPTMVVASSNDPYVTAKRAEQFASAWCGQYVNVGDLGHINTDSNIGSWPDGQRFLAQLIALAR